ncbi:plasmid pRiA4b ORF-3 family protein [Sporolactobacillus sp. THM19-2]|uniref:plasmid pRiA4b ORF-3 family protein n=1 Tax=Sporolactobacillus sp. THM19-2 TaxID=2511171 RepID=UPI0010212A70|nr:plasmid pRiA4b ORF-3 family protein [Sporolactobacillus sp. THM19-2]RYL88146.1 plasmid pRiA4b ORF-3 family protein [Sporolactobacillus sp. THM19-2]
MLIQCTKKLLDTLKKRPDHVENVPPLYSWHANLLTINRRKTVVLMNDVSRYTVVLYGLKAADFRKLDGLIADAIRRRLSDASVNPEIIERYLSASPGCVYAKTKNRAMVARLNKACENVQFRGEVLDPNDLIQSAAGRGTSKILVGNSSGDYIIPDEVMYKELAKLTDQPVIQCRAAVIKATLVLENHDVWRRVVVPLDITFRQLHRILQVLFQWTDSHLHEFTVYKGGKPSAQLVCDKEAFDFPGNTPMFMENDRLLSDFARRGTRIIYTYDFGDGWDHVLKVESIDENSTKNVPVCLEGEENTPPEDVGGEWGYEDYLKIMNDPTHPEHDERVEWSGDQSDQIFDLDDVNFRLETMF